MDDVSPLWSTHEFLSISKTIRYKNKDNRFPVARLKNPIATIVKQQALKMTTKPKPTLLKLWWWQYQFKELFPYDLEKSCFPEVSQFFSWYTGRTAFQKPIRSFIGQINHNKDFTPLTLFEKWIQLLRFSSSVGHTEIVAVNLQLQLQRKRILIFLLRCLAGFSDLLTVRL